jgi:hypothetical protein
MPVDARKAFISQYILSKDLAKVATFGLALMQKNISSTEKEVIISLLVQRLTSLPDEEQFNAVIEKISKECEQICVGAKVSRWIQKWKKQSQDEIILKVAASSPIYQTLFFAAPELDLQTILPKAFDCVQSAGGNKEAIIDAFVLRMSHCATEKEFATFFAVLSTSDPLDIMNVFSKKLIAKLIDGLNSSRRTIFESMKLLSLTPQNFRNQLLEDFLTDPNLDIQTVVAAAEVASREGLFSENELGFSLGQREILPEDMQKIIDRLSKTSGDNFETKAKQKLFFAIEKARFVKMFQNGDESYIQELRALPEHFRTGVIKSFFSEPLLDIELLLSFHKTLAPDKNIAAQGTNALKAYIKTLPADQHKYYLQCIDGNAGKNTLTPVDEKKILSLVGEIQFIQKKEALVEKVQHEDERIVNRLLNHTEISDNKAEEIFEAAITSRDKEMQFAAVSGLCDRIATSPGSLQNLLQWVSKEKPDLLERKFQLSLTSRESLVMTETRKGGTIQFTFPSIVFPLSYLQEKERAPFIEKLFSNCGMTVLARVIYLALEMAKSIPLNTEEKKNIFQKITAGSKNPDVYRIIDEKTNVPSKDSAVVAFLQELKLTNETVHSQGDV